MARNLRKSILWQDCTILGKNRNEFDIVSVSIFV